MERLTQGSFCSRRGFSLLEIMAAMFFVTMLVAVVGGLGQQVMSLAKRSTQTGTILELRSMVNSITRNPDTWLEKMRSSVETQGLYAGCIPDPKVNISTFNCPSADTNLLNDSEIARIAGTQFHVASSPIVSASGEKIAGTVNDPLYLDSEGRICKSTENSQCPLMSTGYFLRSNGSNNEDPGSVKFVIKVEKNSRNIATNSTPMKAQYMSVDIGTEWKSLAATLSGTCPSGSIKVGYLSNGSAKCVNPAKPCANNNEFPIGTDANGNTLCQSMPDCSTTGGHVVLNSSGNSLVCAAQSPCGENTLFLGYFAGTGEPMCSSSSIKCSAGQVQVGIKISGGQMQAECETPPACTDLNKRLSFNGTKFVCEAAMVVMNCADDQVMTGINSDGSPSCVTRAPASEDQSCNVGQEMYGIDSAGKIKCRAASGGGATSDKCTAADMWDSGWEEAQKWPLSGSFNVKTFQHNLGTLDTIVYYELKSPESGWDYGGYMNGPASINNHHGQTYYVNFRAKTANTIQFTWADNRGHNYWNKYVRIIMWKKGCGGAGGGGNLEYFESEEIPMGEMGNSNTQGKLDVPNPFPGRMPLEVRWFLVNKQAEFGFSPGDEIPVDNMAAFSGYISTMQGPATFRIIKRNRWYIPGKEPADSGYNYPQSPKWVLKYRVVTPK